MRRITSILFILLCINLTFAENRNITRLSGFTADIFNAVKTSGDIAYCATDFGLTLMDVSSRSDTLVPDNCRISGNPITSFWLIAHSLSVLNVGHQSVRPTSIICISIFLWNLNLESFKCETWFKYKHFTYILHKTMHTFALMLGVMDVKTYWYDLFRKPYLAWRIHLQEYI